MKKVLIILLFAVFGFALFGAAKTFASQPKAKRGNPAPLAEKNLVRLSKITVNPARLDAYKAFLKEEIEASLRLEAGVVTLYAVFEKEHPNKVTILEIYADQDAYKSHIATPHFQKYKQGTLDMVQDLELIDADPLIPGLKIK